MLQENVPDNLCATSLSVLPVRCYCCMISIVSLYSLGKYPIEPFPFHGMREHTECRAEFIRGTSDALNYRDEKQ